jgi:hypothetical protein
MWDANGDAEASQGRKLLPLYSSQRGGGRCGWNSAPNKHTSSHYTWWSFVPLNLFEQMHRWANLYFLLVVILNQLPQLEVRPAAAAACGRGECW